MNSQADTQFSASNGFPSPYDSKGFESLFKDKRGIFIKMSTPYLKSSRIDESDIFSTAWLTYQMASERWDPTRGASLVTFWINVFRIYLYENYGAQIICTAPDLPSSEDGNDTLDDGYRSEHLAMDASGYAVHDLTGGQDEWTLSTSPVEHVADDEHFSMVDFISAHPAWFHARYRSILSSISVNGTISTAAIEMDRSESRARQLERQLRSILSTPDLVRDSRIPLEDPVSDSLGLSMRYSPVQKLHAHPMPQSSPRAFNQLRDQIHVAQRIVSPLVVDQHGRILDGQLRYYVALHFGMATVPTILHPVRRSVSSDIYDSEFIALRKIVSGRSTAIDKPRASVNCPLFSF